MKCQADEFLPKPPSPKYIPKKTGIDKITQIGDYDLFDYDREVQPILNVLLSKTCEQAILEVEEETELSEIRKFKAEYEKRQEEKQNKWEQEVEREINLIKQKNKALHNARAKRDQEVKTMHKLQCLNISKNFLRGCFMGTMHKLAKHSFWRDGFKDQLTVAYKDGLLKNVRRDTEKFAQVGSYMDEKVSKQFGKFADTKKKIRKDMVHKNVMRAQTRLLESVDKRIVHFIFDPKQPVNETTFTKKFVKMMADELEEYQQQEDEQFEEYCAQLAQEDAGEVENPITHEPNQFYELELRNLKCIAFAVADSPFLKTENAKFYPELHVVNGKGEILTTFGPNNKSCKDFPHTIYMENFRDDKLKINDDRKVRLNLNTYDKDPSIMILLTVRTFDDKLAGDYSQAWFRL